MKVEPIKVNPENKKAMEFFKRIIDASNIAREREKLRMEERLKKDPEFFNKLKNVSK